MYFLDSFCCENFNFVEVPGNCFVNDNYNRNIKFSNVGSKQYNKLKFHN